MEIKYSTAQGWHKDVLVNSFEYFGKSDVTKLRSTLNRADSENVTHQISLLDEDFLTWFIPMYEKRILEKDNPKVFDVRAKTLENSVGKRQYFSLTLFENNVRLGGIIFSMYEDKLSVAYRTLENDWASASLQAKPSLYTEYLICEYAKEKGCKHIVHGKDRNPYGLNSSIGLAQFKLSVGCSAQLPPEYETAVLDTDNLTKDVFVLALPEPDLPAAKITQSYLIVDDAGLEKWKTLLKYSDRLSIEVIKRTK